jgi:hypothetical protein
MPWTDPFNRAAVAWLLEPETPAARYLALRDLLGAPPDDRDLQNARRLAHRQRPIATILDNMIEGTYWEQPNPSYGPKYRGSIWSLITLAQLGASYDEDVRIGRACDDLLAHALITAGQFTANGAPSTTADCLQGNLCAALLDLGIDPARLAAAFDWMARTVTGAGIAPASERNAPQRYYAGKCGPLFACGANNKLSCAWGGVNVMLALGKLPADHHTPAIRRAIQAGVEFLLGTDPATAAYPTGYSSKPSGNWWKFGFPVFYVTDLLQNVEALVALGYAHDPRLSNALALIRVKQDSQGRWPLEYGYTGKTWVDFGPLKAPNKWVTLRALRVLKAVD